MPNSDPIGSLICANEQLTLYFYFFFWLIVLNFFRTIVLSLIVPTKSSKSSEAAQPGSDSDTLHSDMAEKCTFHASDC